ncbi:MAG: glycosyltransferase [Prevotellaceae bacterium]|jgi:glycosyltransferase involved in cell wall biosynthesis|nr:glycosyltransferase [Prevotellaceae bacterium]
MIGLFNDSFPPMLDGVALTVQNYAYWMHRKNQQVCVVTAKMPKHIDNTDYPVYRYASLPLWSRKPYRYGIPRLDYRFMREIKDIPFSIIHVHCPFSSAQLALEIARQKKIPLVATFHSKYKDDFERATHNKKIAEWMTKKVITFYEKADEVWIPQASVEDTIRAYGYKGEVTVMDNGCDFVADEQNIESFKKQARASMNIPDDMPVFLFVGQHIWEKNTRLIIESLAAMKDEQFIMFFIGTGYAEREMRTMVVQYGLSSKVKFRGVISDREQLKNYYAAADLFVFPSLYDNAPLVVREAGALHTPTLMIAGSTASKILTDNYNGFLTENSSEKMAARICGLVRSPQNMKQAGKNAARTVVRSWENITEEVLQRYSQILNKYATNASNTCI